MSLSVRGELWLRRSGAKRPRSRGSGCGPLPREALAGPSGVTGREDVAEAPGVQGGEGEASAQGAHEPIHLLRVRAAQESVRNQCHGPGGREASPCAAALSTPRHR